MTENDPNAAPPDAKGAQSNRVVFVTGPSGAGRSTAVKALEDVGFETIDNLPLSMVERLVAGPPLARPLALGIDVRNRDYSSAGLVELLDRIGARSNLQADLLYLDCSPDVLIRRFSETRRRHPMAPEESPALGVEREIDILVPVRARADILIDTSELTPHELRSEIEHWFDISPTKRLAVSIQSFSYKRGMPHGVDMVFDCRFLRNPHWEPGLRALDGRDKAVQEHIDADPLCGPYFEKVHDLMAMLLPAFAQEGKSHITVAFGCTGGQHRSVAMAQKLANALASSGWQVSIRHWELERHGSDRPVQA